MSSGKSERKENIDPGAYRIQELSEQRIELAKLVEQSVSVNPDAYVSALVDLQKCERQLGLMLNYRSQAQDMKLLHLKGKDEDLQLHRLYYRWIERPKRFFNLFYFIEIG